MEEKAGIQRDLTNLNILGWCYIVFGLLAILGLPAIIVMHNLFTVVLPPHLMELGVDAEQLEEFTQLIHTLHICMLLLIFVHIVFNIYAGIGLIKHKWYSYCFFNTILVCLVPPLGTALGVFTLMVICKPEVKELFEKKPPEQAA